MEKVVVINGVEYRLKEFHPDRPIGRQICAFGPNGGLIVMYYPCDEHYYLRQPGVGRDGLAFLCQLGDEIVAFAADLQTGA